MPAPRPGCIRERGDGIGRIIAHDGQMGAARGQAGCEDLKAPAHEPEPVEGPEAAADQSIVEDEQWRNAIARCGRGEQGRVVVHPEVAPEPDDGSRHCDQARPRRFSRTTWRSCVRPVSNPASLIER